jgi:hypothetical protein
MHPKETINKRAVDTLSEKISNGNATNEETFYSQRIDIDPYMCDWDSDTKLLANGLIVLISLQDDCVDYFVF